MKYRVWSLNVDHDQIPTEIEADNFHPLPPGTSAVFIKNQVAIALITDVVRIETVCCNPDKPEENPELCVVNTEGGACCGPVSTEPQSPS